MHKMVDWEGIELSTSALRMQRYTTKPPALNNKKPVLFLVFNITSSDFLSS